jgi:hypothetical protein
VASGAVSVSSPAARAIPPPGRGAQTAPAWACTHKIAIGDNDLIESALAHFADSSWTFWEVRECHFRTSLVASVCASTPVDLRSPSRLSAATLLP